MHERGILITTNISRIQQVKPDQNEDDVYIRRFIYKSCLYDKCRVSQTFDIMFTVVRIQRILIKCQTVRKVIIGFFIYFKSPRNLYFIV